MSDHAKSDRLVNYIAVAVLSIVGTCLVLAALSEVAS